MYSIHAQKYERDVYKRQTLLMVIQGCSSRNFSSIDKDQSSSLRLVIHKVSSTGSLSADASVPASVSAPFSGAAVVSAASGALVVSAAGVSLEPPQPVSAPAVSDAPVSYTHLSSSSGSYETIFEGELL